MALISDPTSHGAPRYGVLSGKPVLIGKSKDKVGIITAPAVPVPREPRLPGLLLFNAGLIHRAGPHRLNVQIARHAAGLGFTSVRFDFAGIGDSPAPTGRDSFSESSILDAKEVMDFASGVRGLDRFLAIGLCSGADVSIDLASQDSRIMGAVLIDPYAYETPLYLVASYARRALNRRSWWNFVAGDSALRTRIAGWAGRKLGLGARDDALAAHLASASVAMPQKSEVIDRVSSLVARRVRLFFVYSGGPSYYNYLTNFRRAFGRLEETGFLEVEHFAEADHTFTLAYNQRLLLERIDRWLAHFLAARD